MGHSIDFFQPRPYQSPADLEAMKRLLSDGIQANGPGFYVHPGDIQWWLFYPPIGKDLMAHTWLWEDPAQAGQILAWMLVDPSWPSFELFVQPAWFGSDLHTQMYLWAEGEALRLCRDDAKDLNKLWIAEGDSFQRSHLESRGYVETAADTFFVRSLAAPLASLEVPGWTVRRCLGAGEVQPRARAQYGAFESTRPMEVYVQRFLRFMQSEAYAGALDLVAVDAAGQIGAFCIAWQDTQTCRGHLEPVGNHPEFQRQGLARAVLLEALRRLQASGMRSVSVLTPEGNAPAQAFYTSLGFERVGRLGMFQKHLDRALP